MIVKNLQRNFFDVTNMDRNARIHGTLKRKGLLLVLVILAVPFCTEGQVILNPTPATGQYASAPSQNGESVVGTVRVQNGRSVNLVTAAKVYRIEGLIVQFLLKEDGKQWRLEGRLIDELTLEAFYAAPFQHRKNNNH
jgi:hypothetical protein